MLLPEELVSNLRNNDSTDNYRLEVHGAYYSQKVESFRAWNRKVVCLFMNGKMKAVSRLHLYFNKFLIST